jgi:hypothetical protein
MPTPSLFQAFSKSFQTFRLESPSFSKHFFGGFERFQRVTGGPSADFLIPSFFASLASQKPPSGHRRASGTGGNGQSSA